MTGHFVIASLGRGYLMLAKDTTLTTEARWTVDRDQAATWESRRLAEQQLKKWRKVKGFPVSAGVLPGPHAA